MKPLFVPILDMNYYLPNFTGFNPNNLFNQKTRQIINLDIDQILKLEETSNQQGSNEVSKDDVEKNINNIITNNNLNNNEIEREFEKNFSFSDIKKCKYFKMYDSIKDCLEDIDKCINDEKCTIEVKNNTLVLNIPLPNIKYNSIIFTLEEKLKNDEEIISGQEWLIYGLQKDNEKLFKKILWINVIKL